MIDETDKLSEAAQTAAIYADVRAALIQHRGNKPDPWGLDIPRALDKTARGLEPRYSRRQLNVVVAEVCSDMGFDYWLPSKLRAPKKSPSWQRVDQLELRVKNLEFQLKQLLG